MGSHLSNPLSDHQLFLPPQQQAQVVMGRLKAQGGCEKNIPPAERATFPPQYVDGLKAYQQAVLQCSFSGST